MGKLDELAELTARLASQAPPSAWESVQAAAAGKGPVAGYAQELLTMPRASVAMDGVDDFLRNNRLAIGQPMARGRESLVFSTVDDAGQAGHVLKLQTLGAGHGFTLPAGVDGVAGYWAKDRIGPGLQVALQQRAKRVMPGNLRSRLGGLAEEARWIDMANDVRRSLRARGYSWTDPHSGNVGVMPDGNMAAIDGAVLQDADAEAVMRAMEMSPEDAIRMLRAP